MSFWLLAVLLASKGCAMASTASVTEPTDIQRLLSRLGFPIARVASDRVPSAALVSARQDWSSLTPDRSCHTHTPIRLGGRTYRKGLGAHSNGIARFALDGSFLRFKCDVGVDNNSDTAGGKGSVQFVVRVDGREIVRTPTGRGGEAARPIEADVTGARDLELVVLDAGDGIAYDQADWADARLVGAGGKTIYLSDVVARAARSSLMQGDALPSSFMLDGEPSDRVLAAWPKKDSTRPAPRRGHRARRSVRRHHPGGQPHASGAARRRAAHRLSAALRRPRSGRHPVQGRARRDAGRSHAERTEGGRQGPEPAIGIGRTAGPGGPPPALFRRPFARSIRAFPRAAEYNGASDRNARGRTA